MNSSEKAYLEGWNEKCAQTGVDPTELAKTVQQGDAQSIVERLKALFGEAPESISENASELYGKARGMGSDAAESISGNASELYGKARGTGSDALQRLQSVLGTPMGVGGLAGAGLGGLAAMPYALGGRNEEEEEDKRHRISIPLLAMALGAVTGVGAGALIGGRNKPQHPSTTVYPGGNQ